MIQQLQQSLQSELKPFIEPEEMKNKLKQIIVLLSSAGDLLSEIGFDEKNYIILMEAKRLVDIHEDIDRQLEFIKQDKLKEINKLQDDKYNDILNKIQNI